MIFASTLIWYHTQTNINRTHRTNRRTRTYKYILTPPVMYTQQLTLLHVMKNFSKITHLLKSHICWVDSIRLTLSCETGTTILFCQLLSFYGKILNSSLFGKGSAWVLSCNFFCIFSEEFFLRTLLEGCFWMFDRVLKNLLWIIMIWRFEIMSLRCKSSRSQMFFKIGVAENLWILSNFEEQLFL